MADKMRVTSDIIGTSDERQLMKASITARSGKREKVGVENNVVFERNPLYQKWLAYLADRLTVLTVVSQKKIVGQR